MRTLRLSLVGVVALALLGGLGASAAGESGGGVPPEATRVTGTSEIGAYQVGDITMVGDTIQMRDGFLTFHDDMSDPRISGLWVMTWNYDGLGSDTVGPMWGTSRLENDGGAWEGTWSGVLYPPDRDAEAGWFVGEGGYEGLTYYSLSTGADGAATVEGLIFEGDPPPIFAKQAPTSE